MRFKGFEGEWEIKKLGEVVKIYDGTHQTPNYVANGIPFYSVEHVTANQFENTRYISKDIFEKENERVKLEKGDILMTRIGSIGVAKYINWDVKASFYVSLALIKQSHRINNEYLFHYINSNFFQSELWKRTIHVAFPQKINLGEIGMCHLKHPLSDEQQKIASFLTLIDERIQTQSKIIQGLETLIQSLREKLFTQKLRFKDENGQQFPDWEVMQLGDICEKKSSAISANKIEDNFGEYIIYGASGILKKIDFFIEEEDYISIVKDGAGVGRLLYCEGKSSVLGTMDIIKPKQNTNTYFLFHLLKNIDFTKYITGSTIPHIYFKDYKNENCVIP